MCLSLKINSCHLGVLYKAIYAFLASETMLKLPELYTSIFNLLLKIILRNIYSVVCLRKLKTFVMLDFVKICQTLILVWENTFEIFVLIFLRFDLVPGIRTRSRFLGSVPDPGSGMQQIVDPNPLKGSDFLYLEAELKVQYLLKRKTLGFFWYQWNIYSV